jgi:hypothetical protein
VKLAGPTGSGPRKSPQSLPKSAANEAVGNASATRAQMTQRIGRLLRHFGRHARPNVRNHQALTLMER